GVCFPAACYSCSEIGWRYYLGGLTWLGVSPVGMMGSSPTAPRSCAVKPRKRPSSRRLRSRRVVTIGGLMDRAAHESAKGQRPDAVRFEYKELTIPLDLRMDSGSYPTPEQLADVEGFEGMIIGYLGTTAEDGWEA